MRKVMVFGTFDRIHKGHLYFLEESKKYGDKLVVILARDTNVLRIKGKKAYNDENTRLLNMQDLKCVDEAYLGDKKDPYKKIKEIRPDIICLGYDQIEFIKGLSDMFPEIEIKRIDSFHPEKYKNSKIN